MKRIIVISLSILMPLVLVPGCSDDDESPSDPGGGGQLPQTGTLSGVVTATNGTPMNVVTVSTPDKSITQTNEQGYFLLAEQSVGDMVVTFERGNFLTVHQTVTILGNQTTHLDQVAMIAVETHSVNGANGGTAATNQGDGRVIFPQNAFVNGDGTPYMGEVDVELCAMLPTEQGFMESFPGDFEGQRTDGSTVPFISYGFMGVNLFDESKSESLELADGVTAEMRLQVTGDFAKAAPDSIPMWYFEPTTGIWMEEGVAVKEGTEFVADVSHFTIWNWDFPVDDIAQLTGSVQDNQGRPVQDARVIASGVTVVILDEVYTDAEGNFSVRVLVDEEFVIRAIKGSYSSEAVEFFTDSTEPLVLPEPLVLLEPAFSIALQWGYDPSDLDSHLFIPATWDENLEIFHLYYYEMGNLIDDPYTALDTDDVSSYGPEIISGFQFYQGTYQYWVHNYTGEEIHPLDESGATVLLEMPGFTKVYQVEDVNLNATEFRGEWHVFDFTYNPSSGINVIDVMLFENHPDVGYDKAHPKK